MHILFLEPFSRNCCSEMMRDSGSYSQDSCMRSDKLLACVAKLDSKGRVILNDYFHKDKASHFHIEYYLL